MLFVTGLQGREHAMSNLSSCRPIHCWVVKHVILHKDLFKEVALVLGDVKQGWDGGLPKGLGAATSSGG